MPQKYKKDAPNLDIQATVILFMSGNIDTDHKSMQCEREIGQNVIQFDQKNVCIIDDFILLGMFDQTYLRTKLDFKEQTKS